LREGWTTIAAALRRKPKAYFENRATRVTYLGEIFDAEFARP